MLVNKKQIEDPKAENVLMLSAFLTQKVRKKEFRQKCKRHEIQSVKDYFEICFYDSNYDITIQAWRYPYTKRIQQIKRYKAIRVINNKVGNKLVKHQIIEILEHYGFC